MSNAYQAEEKFFALFNKPKIFYYSVTIHVLWNTKDYFLNLQIENGYEK